MDKENVAYVHTRILLSLKKETALAFVAMWVGLEGIVLS